METPIGEDPLNVPAEQDVGITARGLEFRRAQLDAVPVPLLKQLALDAATAEIVREMARLEIRVILLKGAAIATRLYENPADRSYIDIDLLVAASSLEPAQKVLRAHGFVDVMSGVRPSERVLHASPWRRGSPETVTVDLHESIYWYSGDPGALWSELSRETQTIDLGGTPIEVLGDAGQALVIATHVAQHGELSVLLADLERALCLIGREAWADTAGMAARLGIDDAFEAGLRRTRAGAELADELGLNAPASAEMRLRIAGSPPGSAAVMAIAEASGVRDRLRLGAHRLFPSPALMRMNSPLARHGRSGLAVAYLWRPFRLAVRLPGGLRAWRRASRPSQRRGAKPGRAVNRLRALTLPNVRAAAWAWRAGSVVRQQLREGGLEALAAPAPPAGAFSGERGVRAVFVRRPMSCLERAAVRQCWYAAHGSPRDLVIGVKTDGGFGAHAWLDGDPEQAPSGHQQLLRWPAPNQRVE